MYHKNYTPMISIVAALNLLLSLLSFKSFGEPVISPSELDDYLNKTPLADNGATFVLTGFESRIDPRLIVAIAGAETTFGKFICTDFNAWNWFWEGPCPKSPFTSWTEGIKTVTKFMRLSYLNKGYNTIPLIGERYCEKGCEHWEPLVTQFYRDELFGDTSDLGIGEGFTDWMSSDDYQIKFDQQAENGFYPIIVEGRNFGGQSQFRAAFIPFPLDPFFFFSHHGITRQFYEQRNAELTSQGFEQVWVQIFFDASGIERFQATWVKK